MSTDQRAQVALRVEPVKRDGRRKMRASAYLGEVQLHSNVFDGDSDYSRNTFLRKVAEKAAVHGVEISAVLLEAELLEADENMRMGLAPDGSAVDREPDPADVLAAFRLTVLGETPDQGILVWSELTKKQSVIRSPSLLRAEELLQLVGVDAADQLLDESNASSGEGSYSLDQVRRAVALAGAAAPRIASIEVMGQGVWRRGERLLIVDGADAFFYDGSRFTRPARPVIGQSIIDLDAARQWHGSVIRTVRQMTAERSRRLVQRLCSLFGLWNWTHHWDARVLAGLAPATIIQPIWEWRPWVAVTAASDSGKSTFFDRLLQRILLRWTLLADRSTEAGLRQAIAHHAMPILIDEFDQYQHRQRVLELFRTSSKGGKVLRGTADQAGLQFGLHHIPWLAAIESGDVFVQDSNRFIHLELLPPEGRNLVLPTERELHELGVEMAAAAIWASLSAVSLAEVIKGTSIGGVPGRLVESFSVPAAMFAVLRHGREATEAQATNILRGMIDGRQTVEVQREPEHEQLLHEILATNIRVQLDAGLNMVNKELSIGQLMEQHSRYTTELESKGLRVVTPHGSKERMLFIAHDTVLRQLLSGTRWQYLRIDQILARFPGAQRSQQRLHGGRCRGVAIRLSQCLASGDIEEQDRGEERDSQDSGVTA